MAWPKFEELSSSPKLTISRGGNSVTRRFKVTGDDLINFCQYLCDGADTGWSGTPAESGTNLSDNYLFVSDINAAPFADDEQSPIKKTLTSPLTNANGYNYWLVEVTYSLYPYNRSWPSAMTKPTHTAGSTLSCKIRGSIEYISFTANFLNWATNSDGTGGVDATDPPPLGIPGRILIPTADIVVTWDRITNPPVAKWMAAQGKVNHAPYMGFAKECLLFDTYDLDESMWLSTTNPYKYQAALNFKYRANSFNKEFRDTPPYGWFYVLTVDGAPRYPLADFSGLFTE